MKSPSPSKSSTVSFTAKGQVVIPAWLRREFEIEMGSKAVVQSTSEGILLKPITRHTINKLHGALKKKPNEPTLAEEWTRHKRSEAQLEASRRGRR